MRARVVALRMPDMLHASDDDLSVASAHAAPTPRLVINPSPRSDGARRGRSTPFPLLITWGGGVVVGARSGRRWG
jgi:hypothetical protein